MVVAPIAIGAVCQWALTMRIDVGLGRLGGPAAELRHPLRVVEQRRRAVAEVEGGERGVGHLDTVAAQRP